MTIPHLPYTFTRKSYEKVVANLFEGHLYGLSLSQYVYWIHCLAGILC